MRFPKLVSQFFHRRSKSDTVLALARIPKPPSVAIRPISESFLNNWSIDRPGVSNSDSTSLSHILAGVTTEPVAFVPGLHAPAAQTSHTSNTLMKANNQYISTLSGLQRGGSVRARNNRAPVQDIDTSLTAEQDANDHLKSIVDSLESALQIERDSHHATLDVNERLGHEITQLRTDILNLRGQLSAALGRPARMSMPDNDRSKEISRENARLRKFVSLIVSASAHKEVLALAFQRTLGGEDPDEAVIHVIRDDMNTADEVLRALLEPLLGQRSLAEYMAQVNCTLKARREARDWRKKAKFWKLNAKEDIRHADTMTPSVSAMSDVVDELSLERQMVVNEALDKLHDGRLSLKVTRTLDRPSYPITRNEPLDHSLESGAAKDRSGRLLAPTLSLPTPLSPITESATEVEITPLLPDTTDSDQFRLMMVAEARESMLILNNVPSASDSEASLRSGTGTVTDAASTHPYSNLAPLASLTFRKAHSIKGQSVPSRRSSILSLHALAASGSVSSQDSRVSKKSDRRNVKVLALPIAKQFPLLHKTAESAATIDSTECDSRRPFSTDQSSVGLAAESSSHVISLPSSGTSGSIGQSPTKKRRSSIKTPSPSSTPIKPSLISKHPQLSKFTTPPKGHSSSRLVAPTSPKSSSKLPVLRMTSIPRPSIRRLSISKPVLMDTTNAAATMPPSDSGILRHKTQHMQKRKVGDKSSIYGRRVKLVLSPKSKRNAESTKGRVGPQPGR